MNINDVAAVMVLYNPPSDVKKNILSVGDQINRLYIIDNSEKVNDILISEFKKIPGCLYLKNNKNLGIAAALNIGINKAISNGFKYVLTLDQDSLIPNEMINKIRNVLNDIDIDNVGIITPRHFSKYYKNEEHTKNIEEIPYTMTSGNLLNLKAYKDVGSFREEFFIDYVDIEFCFRLSLHGYRILRINNVLLLHNEGNLSEKKIFLKKVHPYNHKPIRWYYKIRNYLYLKSEYNKEFSGYFILEKKLIRNDLLKILLFENKKLIKYRYVIRGLMDFKRGKMGKYEL